MKQVLTITAVLLTIASFAKADVIVYCLNDANPQQGHQAELALVNSKGIQLQKYDEKQDKYLTVETIPLAQECNIQGK